MKFKVCLILIGMIAISSNCNAVTPSSSTPIYSRSISSYPPVPVAPKPQPNLPSVNNHVSKGYHNNICVRNGFRRPYYGYRMPVIYSSPIIVTKVSDNKPSVRSGFTNITPIRYSAKLSSN